MTGWGTDPYISDSHLVHIFHPLSFYDSLQILPVKTSLLFILEESGFIYIMFKKKKSPARATTLQGQESIHFETYSLSKSIFWSAKMKQKYFFSIGTARDYLL